MTTRTVQIIAYGFGPTPATVNVTVNGITAYVGEIPTIDEVYDSTLPLTPAQQVAFTFPLPMEAGTWPMSITMTNGDAVFGPVSSNYNQFNNTYSINRYYDIYSEGTGDCRSNVTIDGVAQVVPTDHTGDWWYYIEQGQVFNCDLSADLASDGPPA